MLKKREVNLILVLIDYFESLAYWATLESVRLSIWRSDCEYLKRLFVHYEAVFHKTSEM